MAERRMFSKTIIDSDAFLDMPISARLLYYDLAMRADDDGIVNSPKKIMRFVGASSDDMSVLVTRQFIIPFESGLVAIRHWNIHNYIRKDTYKESVYVTEKAMLIQDENKCYMLDGSKPSTSRQRSVDEPSTQVSIGKDSIDKVKVGKDSVVEVSARNGKSVDKGVDKYVDNSNTAAALKKVSGCNDKGAVLLSDEQYTVLVSELGMAVVEHYIEKLSSFIAERGANVHNHYLTILKWAKEDARI